MIDKYFANSVRDLLKGIDVNVEEIWQTLDKPNSEDNAAFYCEKLVECLTDSNFYKNEFWVLNQQRIYSTLFVLEFYKNRRPKSEQSTRALKKFQETMQNQSTRASEMKWTIQMVISNNKDECFIDNFFSSIVNVPSEINWESNASLQVEFEVKRLQQHELRKNELLNWKSQPFQKIRCASYTQKSGVLVCILPLSYVCFLDYARANLNQIKPSEYDKLISTLRALMHYAKQQMIGMHNLVGFLHFVLNCITFYSCTQDSIIKQLIGYVNTLRNCWGPVGELATQLFELLQNELKIPGFAFRKKLRYDFPALDCKESTFLNKQYYFVTKSEDSFSCPEDRSLINLRKLIVWHIMKVSGLDEDEIADQILMIRTMANELTYVTYFKALKVVDICVQFEVIDEIKNIMREKMLSVLSECRKRYNLEGKRATAMESEQFDSLILNDNNLHIFRYPLYELTYVRLSDFLTSKSQFSFNSILKRYRAEQSPLLFYRGNLSIIFYGKAVDFTSITILLAHFLEQADIEQCRRLQVFYLPKPDSRSRFDVSDYISCKDVWYRNFVYKVFKESSLFPTLDTSNSIKNMFPSYIYNKAAHMYLREAKRIFKLTVFKVEVKIKDQSQVEVIYFTSHVMIGIFTEAESIRQTKLNNEQKISKYYHLNSLEIIREKIPKYTPLDADIEFQYLEPITHEVHHKKEKNYKFCDLQLCILPKQNFFGSKPDPSGNSVKMSLLNEANGKLFQKEIHNKQNFRDNKGADEISLAFKDLFVNYSIKSLILRFNTGAKQYKDKDNMFKVLVDGILMTKVEWIKITKPVSANGFPISIPIVTFLPFA